MLSRDAIFERLQEFLMELFEIPREKVRMETKLYEELDLDSIDAVDLIVKMQEITGRRMKPDAFKAVRTICDVVDCVEKLMAVDAAVQS